MSRKVILTAIAIFALAVFALPSLSMAQGVNSTTDPSSISYMGGDFQLQGR
jgi:hypothetical protein